MASTDSDTSGSRTYSKSSKKRKHKSEKKHKKIKKDKQKNHRKRTKLDTNSSEDSDIKNKKPKILSSLATHIIVDAFGPALPPRLLKLQGVATAVNSMIGPVLPSKFDETSAKTEHLDLHHANIDEIQILDKIEVNTEELYGPMPVAADKPMSVAEREREQRAIEIKLAAIESNGTKSVDQKVREEWMLELPDVGLKGGLAALSNLKRTFHQGKEKPDFGDRSVWTKTPQTDNKTQMPSTSKDIVKNMKEDAQRNYDRLRDKEQERIARKHKKRHKRDESLVELHQKKLRKEQKQKEKELAAAGAKPERRPFSRDVDLKLNKIDKNQTKSIVDKAKILNTKFASGHTKYL